MLRLTKRCVMECLRCVDWYGLQNFMLCNKVCERIGEDFIKLYPQEVARMESGLEWEDIVEYVLQKESRARERVVISSCLIGGWSETCEKKNCQKARGRAC